MMDLTSVKDKTLVEAAENGIYYIQIKAVGGKYVVNSNFLLPHGTVSKRFENIIDALDGCVELVAGAVDATKRYINNE